MPHPNDDFHIFVGSEHMFFGLARPFHVIRSELEETLRAQVPSSRIHSIVADGEPKFLTLGRKLEDDEGKMVVTHYGVCFQCTIDVESDEHREPDLRCTMTLCVGGLDKPGGARMQTWMHLHVDTDAAFERETFEQRFLEFRAADEAR